MYNAPGPSQMPTRSAVLAAGLCDHYARPCSSKVSTDSTTSNAGRVLTHDQILQSVWGAGYDGDVSLLRSTLRNLRHRLGDDANDPSYIFTEPRGGYRMKKPPPVK